MIRLYLCGGLQSSGSTLVSWCFLQRADMDGVLDARFDLLPILPAVTAPRAWCKFTIACFRLSEVMAHFQDEGFEIVPLLVIRDVRAVFNSLILKRYGRNGISAEDPPLRLRLRRFKEDWKMFCDRGWPMLRFESLATDGQSTLREVCEQMQLPWDDGMVNWKKDISRIAAAVYGNETFISTRKTSLSDSLDASRLTIQTDRIPPRDHEWLETEFAEMNRSMNYPEHIERQVITDGVDRAVPNFIATRRYDRIARRRRPEHLLRRILGRPCPTPQELADATGIPIDSLDRTSHATGWPPPRSTSETDRPECH